jgi:hypothetical protein
MAVDFVRGNASNPQTWNRYAYARNNPISFLDPDGQFSQSAHRRITLAATGSAALGTAVARVDWLGPIPFGDAVVHPARHFPQAGGPQRTLDRAVAAFRNGDIRKAERLRQRAYHEIQDDIGHRAGGPDGRRIGPVEHFFKSLADAFIPGCRFSPDCENSPGYQEREAAAIEKTRQADEEYMRRTTDDGDDEDNDSDSTAIHCHGDMSCKQMKILVEEKRAFAFLRKLQSIRKE